MLVPLRDDGLKSLELFAGIGGITLGFQNAGIESVAMCEIEEFPRKVLAKHWPNIPVFKDIRNLKVIDGKLVGDIDASVSINEIDVISGGFPCQDLSVGQSMKERSGLKGQRSGLWYEMERIIKQVRPRWVVIENSPELVKNGLEEILETLSEIGYMGEWHVLQASDVGLHHRRRRLFIIAHRYQEALQGSDQESLLWEPVLQGELGRVPPRWTGRWDLPDTRNLRTVNGVPNCVDRIKAIGNAVCPKLAEEIGKAIVRREYEFSRIS